MKNLIIAVGVALTLLFGASSAVFGNSWTCEKANLMRQVVVVYPEAPDPLPCSVFYSKPNEHVIPRQLWEAANTPGYCENKAAELVEQLTAWGWLCSLDDAEKPAGN